MNIRHLAATFVNLVSSDIYLAISLRTLRRLFDNFIILNRLLLSRLLLITGFHPFHPFQVSKNKICSTYQKASLKCPKYLKFDVEFESVLIVGFGSKNLKISQKGHLWPKFEEVSVRPLTPIYFFQKLKISILLLT